MTLGCRHRLAGLAVIAATLAAPAAASATTITVNDTGDTAADDGDCVLREAITSANSNAASGAMPGECEAGQASPTEDEIEFEITGAGPHVIAPGSNLPDITEVVTVDGATDGTDEIALDGNPSDVGFGLRLGGIGSTVNALSIYGFGTGIVTTGTGATVEDSFIGTNEAGAAGIGNSGGISVSTTNATVRGNVISGNESAGVTIFSTGATVTGNRIGTTPAGTAALGNGGGVVVAPSADAVTIGGPTAPEGNVISGNTGSGISASKTDSAVDAITELVIERNRIGTGIAGEAAVANTGNGVFVSGNVSGATIADNLISGNGSEGIEMTINVVQPPGAPGPAQNVISGNLIGTDDDGESAIPNGAAGVSVSGTADHPASGNTIGGETGLTNGGACTGDCNVISAGPGRGIELTGAGETEVLGNFVGTDASGTADLGNALAGIFLNDASGSQIGSPAAPNLVSGNGSSGIDVRLASSGNVVQSNLVGVTTTTAATLANDAEGILLNGTGTEGNLIGGTGIGEGNLLSGNGEDGVRVEFGSTDNAILGNSITANGELGIDIGADGVTANDAGDADTGENDLQNFPELEAVVIGGSTVVKGSLDSTASSDFRIEVFGSFAGDASGHGEGREFLGSFDVTTDGSGAAEFVEIVDGTADPGYAVTVTATELSPLGAPLSTSEFALNVAEGTCDIEGTEGDDPGLVGTGADEVICGFGGDDVIDGNGGDDVIVGGTGTDELDYSAAGGAIDADLETGEVTGAGAGDDLVAGIENVTGSDFADLILGDDQYNVVRAGAGKDTVEGRDGDDELKGSDNADTLKGGDGADVLKGQDGGDELRGQSGDDDDLAGGSGQDNLNGGGGVGDDCNGGGDKDETPAKGCETTSSIP